MKKILAATALAGFLAAGPAFAQDATTPAQVPAATTDMSTPSTPAERFITIQAPDDWLASRMIGSAVYGPGDEKLGDINDVIVASNGQIKAVVLGVGGFLGIGEKNVAVPVDKITATTDADGRVKLALNATKDQLKAAPEFVTLAEQQAKARSEAPAAEAPAAPATPAPAQ